jgi:hypothetical protein
MCLRQKYRIAKYGIAAGIIVSLFCLFEQTKQCGPGYCNSGLAKLWFAASIIAIVITICVTFAFYWVRARSRDVESSRDEMNILNAAGQSFKKSSDDPRKTQKRN